MLEYEDDVIASIAREYRVPPKATARDFEDAVHALVLLHDESHEGAFRFCENPVCKLFVDWA